MKRLLPLIIAMIILLTACFNSKGNNTGTPIQSPTPTPSPGPELTSIDKFKSNDGQSTLGVLVSDYISALDPWITSQGYHSLTSYGDISYEYGTDRAYTICPTPGLFLNIYASVENDRINQLVYWLDKKSADENANGAFYDIVKATVYGLDYDTAESILTNLDYHNTNEGVENICESGQISYIYSVDASTIKFYVLPQ